MRQTNNLLTGLAALGLTLTATAMQAADATQTSPPTVTAAEPSGMNPVSVGIEAGTTGPGVRADWRFADNFGVGTAFDYLPISYNGKIEDNHYNANLQLLSAPLTLDLYPWSHSSFHLSVGGLLNEDQVWGNDTSTSINLNGNTYSGTGRLSIKQQEFDPYVSIAGKLFFDSAHHWSLGGELGTFYSGDPRVNLTVNPSTPPPPAFNYDLQTERNKVVHYAKDAEFWPVLKLSFNYSF